jgi:undecaprenyl-diphosphatase
VKTGKRRAALAGIALISFAGLAALALTAKDDTSMVSRHDVMWHEVLRAYAVTHPAWLSSWRVVTHLGDTITVVVIELALVGLCAIGGRRRTAIFVAVVGFAAWAARIGIRDLTSRPRPVDALWPETGFSFPSGHTTNAAVAAGLAVIVLWPISRPPTRAAVLAVAMAYAVSVGFSRAAGGVHWPSDVLGGLLLASGVLCMAIAVRPDDPPRGDGVSP